PTRFSRDWSSDVCSSDLIANTTTVLLGTGTSITQAAMRELAKAGVLVGFCGGGGTPLFAANEVDVEVAWLTPQSEYRPTEYLQRSEERRVGKGRKGGQPA